MAGEIREKREAENLLLLAVDRGKISELAKLFIPSCN
jgi:hypothetical protein